MDFRSDRNSISVQFWVAGNPSGVLVDCISASKPLAYQGLHPYTPGRTQTGWQNSDFGGLPARNPGNPGEDFSGEPQVAGAAPTEASKMFFRVTASDPP